MGTLICVDFQSKQRKYTAEPGPDQDRLVDALSFYAVSVALGVCDNIDIATAFDPDPPLDRA